jgi:hypothetical protein
LTGAEQIKGAISLSSVGAQEDESNFAGEKTPTQSSEEGSGFEITTFTHSVS